MSLHSSSLRDLGFVLNEVLDAPGVLAGLDLVESFDAETLKQLTEAAATFAQGVVAPLRRSSDEVGCVWSREGAVKSPPGFVDAYVRFQATGWPGCALSTLTGGQGLPHLVFSILHEQIAAACHAFGMFAAINHCAAQCLERATNAEISQRWLPEVVSGTVLTTMCLTEPQAGSDLGLLRTRAQPRPDGSYSLTGTKVFSSGGEHDLTPNILHLVLARLPDAPEGTAGLSLFVVPKVLEDGQRNGVYCDGIEHKMGLHGSPTCAMRFEEARAWLISEPHRGLATMFPMMNAARLLSGIQATGLGEAAYRQALDYAKERRQGRAPGQVGKQPVALIEHPDVQRMLLTQKALNEGARAMIHWTALQIDVARAHPDPAFRSKATELLTVLTPLVKGFLCENVQTSTSLALQIHGGHGYIRETGVEQIVRDARVTTLYEGTTGIQAIDLLVRKILPGGRSNCGLLEVLDEAIAACSQSKQPRELLNLCCARLVDLRHALESVTTSLRERTARDLELPYRVATEYLRLCGHAVMASLWGRSVAALEQPSVDAGDSFYRSKRVTARFYFDHLVAETERITAVIQRDSGSLREAFE